MPDPELQARKEIDDQLTLAGWHVCDFAAHDISKPCAIREFPLKSGHGHADYLLYLDGKAVGVVEAKKLGHSLKGVTIRSETYTNGLPNELPAREGKTKWSEENTDGRWRAYEYDELIARDKAELDIFWLKDESLEDSENLPEPGVIVAEIVEDLEATLEQMRLIAEDLGTETT